jgi:imidazolonepropionase-like amidohydrolase
MADRIGSIEAGKFADLIAVPGNPLDEIGALEHVSFVMKGGAVVRRVAGVRLDPPRPGPQR